MTMRNLYLLFITLFFCASNANAQCFVSVFAQSSANCGACNGVVIMTLQGGTGPYYINFNGQNLLSQGGNFTIPNLCPGTYSFIVTDNTGAICSGTAAVTVSGFGNALTTQITSTNPSCTGCTDGSIQVNVSGGMPPYTYFWSNGATTPTIGGLGIGIYTVMVYDTIGCSATDSVYLTFGGANLYALTGKVFFDLDNDSVFGSNDIPLAQQQIEKNPSGQVVFTDQNGDYIFGDTAGSSSTISYLPINGYSISNGIGSYSVLMTNSDVNGLYFAVQPDSQFHAINTYSFTPLPRCNSNVSFSTSITNTGTYVDSGMVVFNFDPLMSYTGSVSGGVVSGNSISYAFDNLLPFETRVFSSAYLLPGAGSTLNTSTFVQTFDGAGAILSSDTSFHFFTVLCSYDPNDKQVFPIGIGANHQVGMEEELRYLIRFQNTGNDTAFNVLVTDTIHPGLNINSLYVIATSHLCWIEKLGGELMRFHFDNILLPDSNVNEPASHGYVFFRIRGNIANSDPTLVTNTSNIYFDFNSPITTNTTLTTFSELTVGLPSASSGAGPISLSPHPMSDYSFVQFDGNPDHQHLLELMDVSGRTVVNNKIFKGSSYLLQRDGIATGTYLLKITDLQNKNLFYTRVVVN